MYLLLKNNWCGLTPSETTHALSLVAMSFKENVKNLMLKAMTYAILK